MPLACPVIWELRVHLVLLVKPEHTEPQDSQDRLRVPPEQQEVPEWLVPVADLREQLDLRVQQDSPEPTECPELRDLLERLATGVPSVAQASPAPQETLVRLEVPEPLVLRVLLEQQEPVVDHGAFLVLPEAPGRSRELRGPRDPLEPGGVRGRLECMERLGMEIQGSPVRQAGKEPQGQQG